MPACKCSSIAHTGEFRASAALPLPLRSKQGTQNALSGLFVSALPCTAQQVKATAQQVKATAQQVMSTAQQVRATGQDTACL